MLSAIVWNPSPYLFPWKLPLLDRPIMWYGLLFAMGFFLAAAVFVRLVSTTFQKEGLEYKEARQLALSMTEKLMLYVCLGVVLGARLCDVIFYQDISTLIKTPWKVLAVWEGGLASHGGVMGIIAAVCLFCLKYSKIYQNFTILQIIDHMCAPAALAGFFIRIGNFMNQEILGKPTHLPWAVIFQNPADGSSIVPRHPVQLYEGAFYLLCFGFFLALTYNGKLTKAIGRLSGIFITVLFTYRFCIEFLKEEQSLSYHGGILNMAQTLSLPLIIFGIVLIFFSKKFAQRSSIRGDKR